MKVGIKARTLSLVLIGAVAGAALISPVAAGPTDPATKKFARQVAKNRAKGYFNKHIGTASVANANTVNGVGIYPITFQTSAVFSKQPVLDVDGLILKASCNGVNSELHAATNVANSALAATSRRVGLSFQETDVNPFNPGTDVDLSPGQTQREMHGRVSYLGGDGRHVTVIWNAEGGVGPMGCNVWGYAVASRRGTGM